MRQNIPVTQLTPGMKVVALDIGWGKSPKWNSPFVLNSGEDLALLLQHCKIVTVATGQSSANKDDVGTPAQPETMQAGEQSNAKQITPEGSNTTTHQGTTSAPSAPNKAMSPKAPAASDLANRVSKQFVIDSFHETLDVLRKCYDKVRYGGTLDADSLQGASKKLLISTIARPGTLSLLSQLEEKDNSLERKSLDVAILALSFGRHLKLPKEQLQRLCLSGLLHDIGMIKVPQELLDHKGIYSIGQRISIQKHVHYGCDILHQSPALRPLNSIVAYHHERFDGTGYPSGLSGRKIPLEARILAIVTTYEALTRNRHFSNKEMPTQALRKIYNLRDQHYDGKLVERFIGSVGVYPVGTLVELNKQQIGMVTDVSPKTRSRPMVRCLFNRNGQPLAKPCSLNLAGYTKDKLKITRTVLPEEIEAFSLAALAETLGFNRVA